MGKRVPVIGTVCVAAIAVGVLASVAMAAFRWHISLHESRVRANKAGEYEAMQYRLAGTTCSNQAEMERQGAHTYCADAHRMLSIPLEDSVRAEAWDEAMRSIFHAVNSVSGMATVIFLAAVCVVGVMRCIWMIVRIPTGPILSA